MFRSLRFRLPALFLAAIVIAGLVSTAVAVSVSRSYAQSTLRKETFNQLGREARGITKIYADRSKGLSCPPPSRELEQASGDQVFYIARAKGIDVFPCATPAYTVLPKQVLDFKRILAGQTVHFEFTPPGTNTRLLGVARPVQLGSQKNGVQTFGAVILAREKTRLNQSWLPYAWRLLPAFFAGILVAGALGWYLSRRITKPVLALSDAADEVAAGHYGVAVPKVPGHDEISHLSERFNEMAAELQAAEALERNFLMTVSHELRTPLTAIRGHVEALLEGVVEDEEARSYSLEVISLEAERLERLVGDVLDLAKLDTHRFSLLREEVDLERLVDRAYSAFGEEARRRGIDYSRSVTATPVLETDGDRVLQVISNLLANAFRWTPDGGHVGLALTQVDGTVRIAVDDSGPGIPDDERERIFRPFWSRDGHGTGLGLAIASELAAALGGEIELQSQAGKGSRFALILPVSRARA
jgi:signal transduction histidine kinase